MRNILLCVLMFFSLTCYSQSSYQLGILPSINLNKKLKKDWKLNFKTESRQELARGFFEGEKSSGYNYLLTDLSIIAAKKIDINKSLAIGSLIRLRSGEVIHRFLQQYILVKNLDGMSLSHRIAADQTFQKGESTEYRFRYRMSASIPFNGQSVDPGESYLKLNNEYLHSFESSDYDLEVRVVPHIGFMLKRKNKIELGLDYRIDSFLTGSSRNRFWAVMNWYLAL